MPYISPENIEEAKKMDLLTYLRSYEPQNLVCFSAGTYCTREHDSLKISNGKWHWFSQGIGGKSALDYLIKVKGSSFVDAVKIILGRVAEKPPVFHAQSCAERRLLMPALNADTAIVQKYLRGRGIHSVILDACLRERRLFETQDHHNALFLGYDAGGVPRYGALRGTHSRYKGELTGSDKRFSFALPGRETGTVHVFESAIDLLSFAALELYEGRDWRQDHLLSLAGLFQTKRKDVVPLALKQFLQDHPHTDTLRLHLDNDLAGMAAAEAMMAGLGDRYRLFNEPPTVGKDVNDQLTKRMEIPKREEYER